MLMAMLLALAVLGLRVASAATFNLSSFSGEIDAGIGVLQSLRPALNPNLDFSISRVFTARNGSGNYHTGDISLSWRQGTSGTWSNVSTATNRSIAIGSLPATGQGIQRSDLTPVFTGSTLNVTRTWAGHDGDVVLYFNITNTGNHSLQLGGVSFPMEFNNILTGLPAATALEECSFVDPYIGLGAGYLQVTQLAGLGPNMIVTPFVPGTQLEGWEFLSEDTGTSLAYQSVPYEGNYAWVVHSLAFAQGEWAAAQPWNPPTSQVLSPGQSVSFGFRFTVVPSVTQIESTVSTLGFPVAVGLPGYIIPQGTNGSLYLNWTSSPSITVSPTGALTLTALPKGSSGSWIGYTVSPGPNAFGRVRVTLTYPHGITQTVQYWVANAPSTGVSLVGQHLSNEQWYTDTSDPFQRAPSIISYDKETNYPVLQDNRVWIAGLSDEGGAGSYVVFSIKQLFNPVAAEVAKLETFVNETAWGKLQYSSGNETYGVKRSMFYYQPGMFPNYTYSPEFNWPGSWDESYASQVDRTYDYVWASILYYSLYKAERISPGVLTQRNASWYLNQAYQTVNYGLGSGPSGTPNTGSTLVGLMGESIWGSLLSDLMNENLTAEANTLTSYFRARQQYWASEADPYGSEQPWDCTGQEAVYFWSEYFNDTATANKTINSIHGYDPAIAHWGYNGNARRYWDFTTAGNPNTSRIERQIHHYGSSLNAIALLDFYRRSATPSSLADLYNLRIGYAGHMASLSNIGSDGFGSMAFHGFATTLAWDTYTGDYGPNFVGHFQTAASYLVQHPQFGWVAFGGNLQVQGNEISVTPLDTLRRRVFISALGLYVQFEAGVIKSYSWNSSSKTLSLVLQGNLSGAQQTIVTFEQTSPVIAPGGVVLKTKGLQQSRGGYVVNIPAGGTTTLSWGVE